MRDDAVTIVLVVYRRRNPSTAFGRGGAGPGSQEFLFLQDLFCFARSSFSGEKGGTWRIQVQSS
jgi:hypothetical protein